VRGLVDSWFFRPTDKVYEDPSDYGLNPQDMDIPVEPGVRLHGWLFESTEPARALVVHCHGNAGNLTGHFPFVAWMPQAGLDVLCFDYRGYGRSTGVPCRDGIVQDGLAAVDFASDLAARRKVPLVLFGQSLGGVVAVSVAARLPRVKAVVLDSPFSGYRREAAWATSHSWLMGAIWKTMGRMLISDGGDAVDEIGRIAPRPVLIMHGKQDRIVDWLQAVELYEAAGEPRDLWLLDDGEHCGAWEERPLQARRRFLRMIDDLHS
jgi:hypothetical protein